LTNSMCTKMPRKQTDFNKILLDSIDDALLTLGESARQSIYFHLEKKYHVPRDEIPVCLEEFQGALEKIFGIGASYLEILVMKNLYLKIGRPLNMDKNTEMEFVKYVAAAKQSFVDN
jgi:adenylyl- and sulfurtransferase ThiI